MTTTLSPNTKWVTVLSGNKAVSDLENPDVKALLKATKVEISNVVEGVTGESTVNVGLRSYYRPMVQVRVKASMWKVVEASLNTTFVDVGYMVRTSSGFRPSEKLASLRKVNVEKGARAILDGNNENPWGALVVEDGNLYLPTSLGAEGWGGSGKYAYEVIALNGSDPAVVPDNTVVVDLFGLSKDLTCNEIVNKFADAVVAGSIEASKTLGVNITSIEGNFTNKNQQSRTSVTFEFSNNEKSEGFITKVANYFMQSGLSHPIVAILRDRNQNVAYHNLKAVSKKNSGTLNATDLSIKGAPMGVLSKSDDKELGLATAVVPKSFATGWYPGISKIEDFHTAKVLAAQRSPGGDLNLTLFATDIEKTRLRELFFHVAISLASCGAAGNYYDFSGKGGCKPAIEDLAKINDVQKVDISQFNQPVFEQPSTPFDVTQVAAEGEPINKDAIQSLKSSAQPETSPQNVLWSRYLETVAARRAASRARSSRSKKARPRSRSGRFRRVSRSRSRTRRGKSPARRRKSKSRSRSRARRTRR